MYVFLPLMPVYLPSLQKYIHTYTHIHKSTYTRIHIRTGVSLLGYLNHFAPKCPFLLYRNKHKYTHIHTKVHTHAYTYISPGMSQPFRPKVSLPSVQK